MSLIENSFIAVMTGAGVAMPAVPPGYTRSIRAISFSNAHAEARAASATITRGAVEFSVVAPFDVEKSEGARAGDVGPGILIAGDVLTFYGSTDTDLTVWVSFHDREVAV